MFVINGIDSSDNMRKKAEELLKEDSFFGEYADKIIFKPKQKELYKSIHNYITGQSSSQIIIINCCYLFASTSLNVDEFVKEVNHSICIASNLNKPKVYIIYQNPVGDFFQKKWSEFKQKITNFKSVKEYPQVLSFSYKSATQSNCKFNLKVDTDILK